MAVEARDGCSSSVCVRKDVHQTTGSIESARKELNNLIGMLEETNTLCFQEQ